MRRNVGVSHGCWWATGVVVLASALNAEAGTGPYRIEQEVISNGGGVAAGGAYHFRSTAGQPASDRLSGSTYTLNGGYWHPVSAPSDRIFANGFELQELP